MTRSGASGSTAVRRTVTIAFSRSPGSPARGATATRTWSSAWPTQRPSGRRCSSEDPGRRADARAREPCLRLGAQREQVGGARLLRPLVDLAGHPRRGRPGPRRVAEHVEPGGLEALDERERPGVRRVVLGREAGDDVGVDRDAGDRGPGPLDVARVVGGQVAAAHPAEHPVVARLERQVEVRQRPRRAVRPRRRAARRRRAAARSS